MSSADVAERPLKKRRFFVDDPPEEELPSKPSPSNDANLLVDVPQNVTTRDTLTDGKHVFQNSDKGHRNTSSVAENHADGFDKQLFESFVGGEVPEGIMERLQEVAGDNMERAINMYLDGSWEQSTVSMPPSIRIMDSFTSTLPKRKTSSPKHDETKIPAPRPAESFRSMPEYRYIGAFGVEGWATRSGPDLLKHGAVVKIERTKIKPTTKMGRGGKAVPTTAARMRNDIIVRFTNARGEEVGRLPKDTAAWVSTLMDQKVCRFDGICVYAPERIRVNDTVYIQLRCSLLRRAFEAGGFVKPENNNRTTGIFEEKETSEEKDLRLRQVAMVKLFDEINLQPAAVNETTAKHKRQGILEAAEIAEQYDKGKDGNDKQPATSSPPNEEETEEGQELEQDQLDTLYKKAQSFDFDTPCKEPAESFVLDLRKYQKQALHWMMGKEKDEKSQKAERSMHPLWEEYRWPTKDVNDEHLPTVSEQESFYVNPYSGELSLNFPEQEQHCLGGILADGKFSPTKAGFVAC